MNRNLKGTCLHDVTCFFFNYYSSQHSLIDFICCFFFFSNLQSIRLVKQDVCSRCDSVCSQEVLHTNKEYYSIRVSMTLHDFIKAAISLTKQLNLVCCFHGYPTKNGLMSCSFTDHNEDGSGKIKKAHLWHRKKEVCVVVCYPENCCLWPLKPCMKWWVMGKRSV